MTGLTDEVGMCIGTLGADPIAVAQDLPAVLAAVAASGAPSVSIHAFLGAMYGPEVVAGMLADAGLRAGALEAALAWSAGPGDAVIAEAEQLLAMAEATGAREVLTVVLDTEMDRGAASDGLAQLCGLLAPAGVRPCLEWLPWTAMPTIASAVDLLHASGAPNCGLTFDTWHWMRQPGGPDLATLDALDGGRIGYLQLCDVAPTPGDDVFVEAMTARLLPGDGVVDFHGLFDRFAAMGATPYVASEIFNSTVLEGGAAAAAVAFHEACARL